jgi:cephalosporin hydroxylase
VLPPPADMRLTQSVREYWLERVKQHTEDSYAGVRMSKFPEDLRVYEHLLWLSRPTVVIEIGAQFGGSALWFRDRLRTLVSYGRISTGRVISIDLDITSAQENLLSADRDFAEEITLIAGDVRDSLLPDRVAAQLPPSPRCFVVEDSAHTYETTMASLRGFSRFVSVGGFFIVEDGCVDVKDMRLSDDWPRGVLPALHDWLSTEDGVRFAVRRNLEIYGISCHPQGFLERTRSI